MKTYKSKQKIVAVKHKGTKSMNDMLNMLRSQSVASEVMIMMTDKATLAIYHQSSGTCLYAKKGSYVCVDINTKEIFVMENNQLFGMSYKKVKPKNDREEIIDEEIRR